jgi:hypothetical protein
MKDAQSYLNGDPIDLTYARVDPPEEPGYLTCKSAT